MPNQIYLKNLILLLGLCFCPFLSFSQQQLSKDFTKTIEYWEHFHNNKDYKKAIEKGEEAFILAEQLNDRESKAIALNRVGLSLMQIPKRQRKNRKTAKGKFEKSLYFAATVDNVNLRINNLEQLKLIAEKDKEPE